MQGGLRCGNEGVGRRLELAKENGDFVIIVIIVIVFIVTDIIVTLVIILMIVSEQ